MTPDELTQLIDPQQTEMPYRFLGTPYRFVKLAAGIVEQFRIDNRATPFAVDLFRPGINPDMSDYTLYFTRFQAGGVYAKLVSGGWIDQGNGPHPAETSADNGPQVISIPDERIAKIRSMFSGGKSPSDKQIAAELIVSESLAKKLRLQAGIKRRERKKSMS